MGRGSPKRSVQPLKKSTLEATGTPRKLTTFAGRELALLNRFEYPHALGLARLEGRKGMVAQAISTASFNYKQNGDIPTTWGFVEVTTGLPRWKVGAAIPALEESGMAVVRQHGTQFADGGKETRYDLTCPIEMLPEVRRMKNAETKRLHREHCAPGIDVCALRKVGVTNEETSETEAHSEESAEPKQILQQATQRPPNHLRDRLEERRDGAMCEQIETVVCLSDETAFYCLLCGMSGGEHECVFVRGTPRPSSPVLMSGWELLHV
jgi:hypothetical protein